MPTRARYGPFVQQEYLLRLRFYSVDDNTTLETPATLTCRVIQPNGVSNIYTYTVDTDVFRLVSTGVIMLSITFTSPGAHNLSFQWTDTNGYLLEQVFKVNVLNQSTASLSFSGFDDGFDSGFGS